MQSSRPALQGTPCYNPSNADSTSPVAGLTSLPGPSIFFPRDDNWECVASASLRVILRAETDGREVIVVVVALPAPRTSRLLRGASSYRVEVRRSPSSNLHCLGLL